MKKEKKNKQKKKIKSSDLQMTLNKDLTAALRFKNVAFSLRPPTRPLHSCRGCHGCHMFVTWLVPVSGWLIRYRITPTPRAPTPNLIYPVMYGETE